MWCFFQVQLVSTLKTRIEEMYSGQASANNCGLFVFYDKVVELINTLQASHRDDPAASEFLEELMYFWDEENLELILWNEEFDLEDIGDGFDYFVYMDRLKNNLK